MHDRPDMVLPETIRSIASRSGCKWGWRPDAIPQVIDAAEQAGLLNIGGQLQFRLPGATCECYWVEVDAVAQEPRGLRWTERVARAATVARQQFADIGNRYDFLSEGRDAFPAAFHAYEASGGNLGDCLWFIWYLKADRTRPTDIRSRVLGLIRAFRRHDRQQ
ncbi:hypothetical protein ASE70_04995 [Sphingomonas sp. Leaf22]|uniref:hypothetical protein n=1 Tax=Sphingomonas sp. Leaf22 TaxID=1735687 RepID=UPI0006F6FE4C|nr:hypothetical protein [Sphingomonas sp. Leaf22]KQM79248.1 hypothetical protein ASE70_04995 [Sphingomonas sp. Leaf22]